MANQVVKTILQTMVDDAPVELLVRTTADQVTLDDQSTVQTKIEEIVDSLNGKVTAADVQEAIANKVDKIEGKGLSTEDFTTELKNKLEGIVVPTKVSDLTNDANYQTEDQVNAKISAVYKPGGSVAFASLPTADADHLGMVYNVTDAFTTTDDFVEGAGSQYPAGTNVVVVSVEDAYKYDVLSGMVDLTNYVQKDGSKVLSTNDYTNEDKSKLAGIAAGAQVNVLEGVQVNNVDVEISNKKVNISVPNGALASKDQVSETDLDEALAEKVNAASEGNHSHANKAVLDEITSEDVTNWDSKSRIIVAASQPENLKAGDLWFKTIE